MDAQFGTDFYRYSRRFFSIRRIKQRLTGRPAGSISAEFNVMLAYRIDFITYLRVTAFIRAIIYFSTVYPDLHC